MFGQIKGKLEFFQFPFYLAEKAGRKEKAMQIRDGPKENCREKSDHERRTCTWKKMEEKMDGGCDGFCSVLHYALADGSFCSIRR